MKQKELPVFISCGVLAIVCYTSSLLGHMLPNGAAPVWLRHHWNDLSALGGLFLAIELLLGIRLRALSRRQPPAAHL